MDRLEEKRIARDAYIAAVERGEVDADSAFLFRGLERARVKMYRRRLPSATQVAEAA